MSAEAQLKGLAKLLLLLERLREAKTAEELGSCLVEDSRLLVRYRTAVLCSEGKVVSVSGLPAPARDAPFTHWMRAVCRHFDDGMADVREVDPAALPESLREQWREYLPSHLLWIPLAFGDNPAQGVLLLARAGAWRSEEQELLTHWARAAAHAMAALRLRQRSRWLTLLPRTRTRRLAALVVTAAAVALLLAPVRLSVLAPAEVVAQTPNVVRAPLDGVIGEVLVEPNAAVEAGELLLRLDDTALRARMDVAAQELEIARAERLRAEQASVLDRAASGQIPILNARIRQRSAELEYVRSLLARIEVRAERSGIAVMPPQSELTGKPVAVGERLLTLADPAEAALEFWLPVGDGLRLPEGAAVRLYLNVAPENPVEANLRHIDYQARPSPDGVLAYRARAAFGDGELPRIGWRGTARVYGEPVTVFYFLFRRPLATARQFLGT